MNPWSEATVAKWFKAVGDAVAMDEPLVELETDKVTRGSQRDGRPASLHEIVGRRGRRGRGRRPARHDRRPPTAAPKPEALRLRLAAPEPAPKASSRPGPCTGGAPAPSTAAPLQLLRSSARTGGPTTRRCRRRCASWSRTTISTRPDYRHRQGRPSRPRAMFWPIGGRHRQGRTGVRRGAAAPASAARSAGRTAAAPGRPARGNGCA